ncbi:Protein-lysine N-methyltransferase EFM2 [Zalerion maritima]|uniref:Protein-lysine N-methyltransferase EFM2 n=1 Tax=Zalerion maritima TaxID=339359 RepID=A0AAD5RMY6_9PEZI|nr:Protein-lysine N-methyltransferase EFM2 [Zalerion maritima]
MAASTPGYIHPLDFPYPYQKPTFTSLLSCLQTLRLDPPTWGSKSKSRSSLSSHQGEQESRHQRQQHRQLVTSYLTRIISSPLSWIPSDDEREILWEEASRRLSERCGRSGMGEMTRFWPFVPAGGGIGMGEDGDMGKAKETEGEELFEEFTLTIREPPLTGDHLGLKTWCSSCVMAQKLPEFRRKHLGHLFPVKSKGEEEEERGEEAPAVFKETKGQTSPQSLNDGIDSGYASIRTSGEFQDITRPSIVQEAIPSLTPRRPAILELGSGTGLLGLSSSILFAPSSTHVLLTDLPSPEIISNLSRNISANLPLIESRGGSVSCAPLTWGDNVLLLPPNFHSPPESSSPPSSPPSSEPKDAKEELVAVPNHSFPLILVADPLYDAPHPALLSSCITTHLSLSSAARCIAMVPLRDEATRGLLASFLSEMSRCEPIPFVLVDEGSVRGQDDWEEASNGGGYYGDGEDEDRSEAGSGVVECWWGVFKRNV